MRIDREDGYYSIRVEEWTYASGGGRQSYERGDADRTNRHGWIGVRLRLRVWVCSRLSLLLFLYLVHEEYNFRKVESGMPDR